MANANGGYTFSVVVLGANKYLLNYFVAGTTDDLEDICRKIVAHIDGSVFEPIRRVPHYDGQGRLIE